MTHQTLKLIPQKRLERILLSRMIYKKTIWRRPSFEQFLMNICTWIAEVLKCDGTYIFLDDPINKRLKLDRNTLVLVAQHDEDHIGITGQKVKASDASCIAKSYREKVLVNIPLDRKSHAGIEKKFNFTSALSAPITIKNSPIGTLLLTHTSKKIFPKSQYTLFQLLADFIGSTIESYLDYNRSYFLSITDNLTGLYNDRYFHEVLYNDIEECVRANRSLHLIFFDLDNLKKVNDNYGHLAGSKVLSEVGQIVGKRQKQLWAARYGGDEFVVIFKDKDDEIVKTIMEEFRVMFKHHTFLTRPYFNQEPLHLKNVITASFGIASLAQVRHIFEGAEKLDVNAIKNALIKKSDEAMYKAKTTGKDKVVVSV